MTDHLDIVKFGVALFAILNPIGNASLFLSLTDGNDDGARRRIAAVSTVAILITLAIVALVGRDILAFFGITVDDLRIAGGLVVLFIGMSMLHAETSAVRAGEADVAHGQEKDNPAVVPLAIPIVAGPGAMATIIVIAEGADSLMAKGLMLAAIAVNALIVLASFLAAVPLQRLLGPSGMSIIVRVMGLILAAIAVDMMATGLKGTFPILASPLPG